MVLMAMGEEYAAHEIPILDEIGKVWDDDIYPGHFAVWKTEAGVDYDDVVALSNDRAVLPDLPNSAKRDYVNTGHIFRLSPTGENNLRGKASEGGIAIGANELGHVNAYQSAHRKTLAYYTPPPQLFLPADRKVARPKRASDGMSSRYPSGGTDTSSDASDSEIVAYTKTDSLGDRGNLRHVVAA